MGFLDFLSPIVGGVSSVVGLIQDGQARQRALEQQQQALQAYGQAADQQYQNMLGNNSRTLYGLAGQGATAISNLGANLGSALAGAGVYNSSATAGALAQAQRDADANIGNLAAQNSFNANSFYHQAQQNLAQMRLGQANIDYGNANADLQGSRQGLGSFLGALSTSDLLGGQGAVGAAAVPNPDYSQLLQQGGITEADLTSGTGQGVNPMQGYDPNTPLGFGTRAAAMAVPGSPAAMGAMTQANLASSGANAYRTALPQIPGTISQGANLGGNAGGIGSPFYSHPAYSGWSGLLDRYTTGLSGALSGR
ncbi:MAG: hypothetical protein JWL77_6704 [Chthonomonadaceae bacterium]|nr:hypothetical protein [Chthonomonadaceae bacterium]